MFLVTGCYAPSAGNEPEFFYKCKDVQNHATEKHGMIVDDLNTTLNPDLDRKNYKTDSHKKSGMVINNWISNEEMIVFFIDLPMEMSKFGLTGVEKHMIRPLKVELTMS